MELIQAGFHPTESKFVQNKLKQVIKTSITTAVEKYKIPLKDSIAAWLIPGKTFLFLPIEPLLTGYIIMFKDPTVITADHLKGVGSQSSMRDPLGLLKEGEVYFRSSVPMKDENELPYYVIKGPVLVSFKPLLLDAYP